MALEMVTMFSVAVFVGLESFWYSERLFALGAVSDILHVPTWIPHSAVGFGFFAIALIVLVRGLEMLRRPDPTP
jgi:TRAP-type C4-dicarboxylate transport system permease small subunit